MRPLRLPALLSLPLAVACIPHVVRDRQEACQLVTTNRALLERGPSPRELIELADNTPAKRAARSAYAQGLSALTLGGIGGAALVAGFITGFAVDSSQPAVRGAGYGIVGGAIGLFAVSLTLGLTGRKTVERAKDQIAAFAHNCQ